MDEKRTCNLTQFICIDVHAQRWLCNGCNGQILFGLFFFPLSYVYFSNGKCFCKKFYMQYQTSVAATSTIYQLSQNPDKQEILYNELKSIMPDVRSPVDTKILEQMPFLRACIKETLRYPMFVKMQSASMLTITFVFISFFTPFQIVSRCNW